MLELSRLGKDHLASGAELLPTNDEGQSSDRNSRQAGCGQDVLGALQQHVPALVPSQIGEAGHQHLRRSFLMTGLARRGAGPSLYAEGLNLGT